MKAPDVGEGARRIDPSQKHAAIARRLADEETERVRRMRAFLASGRAPRR